MHNESSSSRRSAALLTLVGIVVLLVSCTNASAAPAERVQAGAARMPEAPPLAVTLASGFDSTFGSLDGATARLAPGIFGQALAPGGGILGDALTAGLDRLLPPAPRCFVAGFTGWDSDDLGIDSRESDGHRTRFNEASGTWYLMRATGDLHDGSLHIWRFYQWDDEPLEAAIAAFEAGRPIVLAGHSAGGAAALSLAWELHELGIPVALLIEMDTYTGGGLLQAPPWVHRDGRDAPPNVQAALNFYQDSWWMYKGRAQAWAGEGDYTNLKLDSGHGGLDTRAAELDVTRDAIDAACAGTAPTPPLTTRAAQTAPGSLTIDWLDRSRTETGFAIYRAECTAAGVCGPYQRIAEAPANASSATITAPTDGRHCYAVSATNPSGESAVANGVATSPGLACP